MKGLGSHLKKTNQDLPTYKEILNLLQDVIHPLFIVHFQVLSRPILPFTFFSLLSAVTL